MSSPVPSQRLRVFAVGPVSAPIRQRCLALDASTRFFANPAEVKSEDFDALGPTDAALIVATEIDVCACRALIRIETAAQTPRSVGFVVNPDAQFVLQQLEGLSATPPSATQGPCAAFLDDALVGINIAGIRDVRGQGATANERGDIARSDLACLFLYGHSNGHCHGGGGLALCQRDRHAPRPSQTHQLPCFGGAPCRFDLDKIAKVATDEIRAGICIDFTCFGYVVGDHALLAADAVGKALLENPQLDALVTSLRAFSPNQHDYALAAYLALQGCEMGTLAGAVNRARTRDSAATPDFICLGDPRARLSARLHDSGDFPDGDLALPRHPASDGGPCDQQASIPPSQNEVLLFSGASAAAWAPDGTVYFTLPAEKRQAEFMRVPTEVARATMSSEPLIPGLDFLEHHLAVLAEHPIAAKDAALAAAIKAAQAARHKVRRTALTFHPDAIRNGSVFEVNTLHNLDELRTQQLEALADALAAVHQRTLTARGLLFAAGAEMLTPRTAQHAGPACGYCGSGTTHIRKGVPGSSYERTVAFCEQCGRQFEGPGFATTIKVDGAGHRWTLRIDVTNGFPFEVPVRGVAAIQTFSSQHNQTKQLKPVTLEPDESVTLQTDLTIDPRVPYGMHRAKAAIVVGSQVDFLLRNALLTP